MIYVFFYILYLQLPINLGQGDMTVSESNSPAETGDESSEFEVPGPLPPLLATGTGTPIGREPRRGPRPSTSGTTPTTHRDQLAVHRKKKRKVGVVPTDFKAKLVSQNKQSTEQMLSLLQTALEKPRHPDTNLATFGRWIQTFTTNLHPSLEKNWTRDVSKNIDEKMCKMFVKVL